MDKSLVAAPLMLEHEDARWLSADELRSVKWLPADVEAVSRVESILCDGARKLNLPAET